MDWAKKHKILTVVGVIVLLGVISSVANGGNSTTNISSNSSSNSKTVAKKELAKIGVPVTDGKFEFTVKGIECGKTTIGVSSYLTKDAQGQFCMLNVTIKNTGDAAQSLFSAYQKILNAESQQYAADDTATMYAAPNGSSWYSNINPGNSVEGTIVFDIPKDQTPAIAELHDSMFSSGVKVSLQ